MLAINGKNKVIRRKQKRSNQVPRLLRPILPQRGKIHADPPGRQPDALRLVHVHARVVALDEGDVHALGAQVGDELVAEVDLVLVQCRRRRWS